MRPGGGAAGARGRESGGGAREQHLEGRERPLGVVRRLRRRSGHGSGRRRGRRAAVHEALDAPPERSLGDDRVVVLAPPPPHPQLQPGGRAAEADAPAADEQRAHLPSAGGAGEGERAGAVRRYRSHRGGRAIALTEVGVLSLSRGASTRETRTRTPDRRSRFWPKWREVTTKTPPRPTSRSRRQKVSSSVSTLSCCRGSIASRQTTGSAPPPSSYISCSRASAAARSATRLWSTSFSCASFSSSARSCDAIRRRSTSSSLAAMRWQRAADGRYSSGAVSRSGRVRQCSQFTPGPA